MISDLRTALSASQAEGPTIRLLRSVLSAIPEQARLESRGGLGGLLAEPAMARVIREDLDVSGAASDIAAALDRGELLNAVAVTPRVALSLYDAHLEWALGVGDLEREHARDASVRLHGIGLLAQRLFEGSTPERAGELLSYEAGRAMLIWFIAVELVLAVSTEDEPATAQQLRDLLEHHGEAVIQDLNHLASRADREGGQDVIKAMLGVISPVVQIVAGAVPGIAGAVRRALPELTDNGQEALMAEANELGIYTLLTARLVAEIEAERCEEALPAPPPPAPQNAEEIQAIEVQMAAAQARWDPAPIAAAQSALKQIDAQLDSLGAREVAHKKSLRAIKRKLARTVDRRARLAEAPPAGQAEAEAAAERAVSALKDAEKLVKKAVRQLGTREERVVAAKAALKRRDAVLAEQRQAQKAAELAAEALQRTVSQLQEEDEAQAAEISKAVVAQAEAQAQAQVDMGARLEAAKARSAAIDIEIPRVREKRTQIGAQLVANKGALADLSENREGLADALVLAREAQPDQQTERKSKAEILAQAQVNHSRSDEKLKTAAAGLKEAGSATTKAEKVAAKARERLRALDDDVNASQEAAEHAAGVVRALKEQIHQGGLALKANAAAQSAAEAAQAAARSEASSAVQRALTVARERHAALGVREQGIAGAMGDIQERTVAHTASVKALDAQRTSLQTDLVQARAEHEARLRLIDEHLKQVLDKDSTLGRHEGELPGFVKVSRKAAAVHAGAAARVVGARDALSAATRRVSEAQKAKDSGDDEVGQLGPAVQAKKEELAVFEMRMEAESSKRASPDPSDVDALLAAIKPPSQSKAKPATPSNNDAAEDASDDAATAMFTPDALQARLLREQEEEDAANATVMFARKTKAPKTTLKLEPEEEEEDATVMFTLDELRARAAAEEEGDDLPDDETVIFHRPIKDD